MATEHQKTETKYGWQWILTITRAPENSDLVDGQKIVVAESNSWFDTEQEAREAASLSRVCDIDHPDSWGFDLVIFKETFVLLG